MSEIADIIRQPASPPICRERNVRDAHQNSPGIAPIAPDTVQFGNAANHSHRDVESFGQKDFLTATADRLAPLARDTQPVGCNARTHSHRDLASFGRDDFSTAGAQIHPIGPDATGSADGSAGTARS